MKTKFLLTLSVALFTIGLLQAQDNFKRGYVISNKTDTLYGWIDYQSDQKNAMICKFKTTELEQSQELKPGQIESYQFIEEGKYYVSRNIKINNAQQTVFLEYLVKGEMNLYYYIDDEDDAQYYFFEDQTGKMIPVPKQQDKEIVDDGLLKVKKDMRYKQIVKVTFQDYEPLNKDVKNIDYTHKSMINLAKDYHNLTCTTGEQCIVFETKEDKQKIKFKFSGYGGMYWFQGKAPNYRKTFSCPAIGAQVNVSMTRDLRFLSFQLDFSVGKTDFKGIDNQLFLNLMYGIKYTYPKGIVRPTLEVNIGNLINGDDATFYYNASAGVNFKVHKEQFIFCNIGYSINYHSDKEHENYLVAIRFYIPQLKIGYIF